MQRLWILNDLFVAPAARRNGIGGALMAAAESFARDEGARGLLLATQKIKRDRQGPVRVTRLEARRGVRRTTSTTFELDSNYRQSRWHQTCRRAAG